MTVELSLQGRVAMVTGAASGLGRAAALALARRGARVAICDVNAERGEAAAQEICADGLQARYVRLDVADEDSWRAATAEVGAALGVPVVLVNNAGIADRQPIMATSLDGWNRVLSVNLTGAFLGIRAVVPGMAAAGGGSIINVSSTSGLMGHTDAAYSASKWALRALTKTAAIEFADVAIRVNSVHPGSIPTGIQANAPPGHAEIWRTMIPMGRTGRADEVAAAIVFLASDAASYMTGSEMIIDGGLSQGGVMAGRKRMLQDYATKPEAGKA